MKRKIRIPDCQEHLPFQHKKRGGVLAYATPIERQFLAASIGIVVLLMISYVYLIMSSVTYAAKAEEVNRAAKLSATEVARLESQFLAVSDGVTETRAILMGYVSPKSQSYIEKTSFFSER